ncbi:MAG: hypothetical protein DMG19_00925 [Acidobacteria bacterium]|nr:MAG: hypothetical protein DMG19_00925 [Acidobacteriota bacterium]
MLLSVTIVLLFAVKYCRAMVRMSSGEISRYSANNLLMVSGVLRSPMYCATAFAIAEELFMRRAKL